MKKKSGDISKQALLQAATRLFALNGVSAVTLNEIAKEADIDACMINYHFGGKQGLIDEVVKTAMERWKKITLKKYYQNNAMLLETREGQQVFIAGLVETVFRAMGPDESNPDPGQVLFLQLLQCEYGTRSQVYEKYIKPLVDDFFEIYQKITGSKDFDSAFCWFLILTCPKYMGTANPSMINPLHPSGKVPSTFSRRLQYATTQLLLHGLGLV